MKIRVLALLGMVLWVTGPLAQLAPETVGSATLAEPGDNWFLAKTWGPAYLFDADSGEMQGLLSLSDFTPSLAVDRTRRQVYAPESYFSRGVHGDRTDILAIYDFDTLAPVAEVDIPDKIAALPLPRHVGLVNDSSHVLVFNMTPAQSISVVNVETRTFAGEISTPGCAVIMPVQARDFLMICADGTLQLIRLADDGSEASRHRSDVFFDVLDDPVFDRPVPTADGWLLTTHAGRMFEVTVEGDQIRLGDAWRLADDAQQEAGWRPGGGEFISTHTATGLTYVLMHQAEGEYTHHDPGTEIWVLHTGQQRTLTTIPLEAPAFSLYVTQSESPRLLVADEEGQVQIFDAISFAHEMTIEEPGLGVAYLRGF